MTTQPKATQPIRWTITAAASEFQIDRRTLTARLARSGAEGERGTWSTVEICAAVFGDLDGEKLRKLKAEADLAEMERDERARALLPADMVAATWTEALGNLRAVVMAADIPKITRAQLIRQLQEIPLAQYTQAREQQHDNTSNQD